MNLARIARRFGNGLYKYAFPIYRPLYYTFKTYTDRSERRLLMRNLYPGSIVVDAGANIGIYSQFLSIYVGPNGLVHSFEPDPENYAHLRATRFRASNVRLNPLAVGDKTGPLILYASDSLNVDHRSYPSEDGPRKAIAIDSIRLDDYFESGARVDLIKMDIQGFELHALHGATRVIAENPTIKLLLELWPYGLRQAGCSAEELIDLLYESGFSILTLDGQNLRGSNRWADESFEADQYFNIFAWRKGVPPRE